jgi:molybdopterin synthase catalytic subunit
MAAEPTTDWELQEDGCYAGLTKDDIDITATMDRVRSPQAGAMVLFAGD